jgi:hypothetical protein
VIAAALWAGWRPASIVLCEKNLTGWIAAPANAWSSIAYVLVGAALIFVCRPQKEAAASWFGPVAIVVGICSFLFHASYTFVFQALDYASMYLLTSLFLTLNVRRFIGLSGAALVSCYIALVALSVAPFVIFGGAAGRVMFALHVAAIIASEAVLAMHARVAYAPYVAMFAIFSAAWLCWFADETRALCWPYDHLLQLHAAWHVVSSGCFVAAFRFYSAKEGVAS